MTLTPKMVSEVLEAPGTFLPSIGESTENFERKRTISEELIMLTTDEICEVLHCSSAKLSQLAQRDKTFPMIKVGKENVCYLPALQQWLMKPHDLRGD